MSFVFTGCYAYHKMYLSVKKRTIKSLILIFLVFFFCESFKRLLPFTGTSFFFFDIETNHTCLCNFFCKLFVITEVLPWFVWKMQKLVNQTMYIHLAFLNSIWSLKLWKRSSSGWFKNNKMCTQIIL